MLTRIPARTCTSDSQARRRCSRLPGPAETRARDSAYIGSSTDGSIVYISTIDALLPEDTDGRFDVYQRSDLGLRLVTTGPAGGNSLFDARGRPGFRGREAVRVFHRRAARAGGHERDQGRLPVGRWRHDVGFERTSGSGVPMFEFLELKAGGDGGPCSSPPAGSSWRRTSTAIATSMPRS